MLQNGIWRFGRRSSRLFQGSSAIAMAIQSSVSLASQTRTGLLQSFDVILTTSSEPVQVDPTKVDPMDGDYLRTGNPDGDAPIKDKVVNTRKVIATRKVGQPSKARLFQQIAARASRAAQKSEVEQRFISLLPPEARETVRASSDIYQAFSKVINDDAGDGELSKAEVWQDGRFQRLEASMCEKTELLLAK
ncbi:unnamed protein product [Mortierella alpina]